MSRYAQHPFGKSALFAYYGALGCLLGALVGEIVLAALLPRSGAGQPVASSLVNREFDQRLAAAGARSGDVQLSLIWDNLNDIDLHCVDPRGEHIFYGHRRSMSHGELDIDRNASAPFTPSPVENIYWPAGGAPPGHYLVLVHHYANHGSPDPTKFTCRVRVRGQAEQVLRGSLTFGEAVREIASFDVAPRTSGDSSWRTTVVVSLWTALLALGLSYSLIIGQNRYQRRSWLTGGQAFLITAGGAVAGLLSGFAGQTLFATFSHLGPLVVIGRIAGWLILGWLLGWGMSSFVPNLPRTRAAQAGAIGGTLGGIAFQIASGAQGDVAGRLLGAIILGACIGLMIALVEALGREAWLLVHFGPRENSTLSLGGRPIVLGSSPEADIHLPAEQGFPAKTATVLFAGGHVILEDCKTGIRSVMPARSKRTFGTLTIEVFTK